jgi:hypothetical protein
MASIYPITVTVVEDLVHLNCSNLFEGAVEVISAGQNTSVNGNLHDHDPYKSFFTYLDLDKKNGDGTYLFNRNAKQTTLRPDYEPRYPTGYVICDQINI